MLCVPTSRLPPPAARRRMRCVSSFPLPSIRTHQALRYISYLPAVFGPTEGEQALALGLPPVTVATV
jgi:hypothetical protein